MFKKVYERCDSFRPHLSHRWYPHWYSKTRICLGRESDVWRMANPALGVRITEKDRRTIYYPELHKHHYHVRNNVLVTPHGMPVDNRNVYWQCVDHHCWHIFSMPREEVKKELTRKKVEQSWPA